MGHTLLDILQWAFLCWGLLCAVAAVFIGVLTVAALLMGARCERGMEDRDRKSSI